MGSNQQRAWSHIPHERLRNSQDQQIDKHIRNGHAVIHRERVEALGVWVLAKDVPVGRDRGAAKQLPEEEADTPDSNKYQHNN